MRTTPGLIGSVLGSMALTIGGVAAAAPVLNPATTSPNQSTLIGRGEYLADVAHCTACHTNGDGPKFAGNLPMATPFGTLYTANITSDKQYGIGNWTEKQFEGALRRGVNQHGEYLYPAMPYVQFTKVTDDDIHALYTYFKTVKPVHEAVKKNDMNFPFNVRPGLLAWQMMFFKQGRYVRDTSQSDEWNRGAYLVQGLGHCEACHSPTNLAMAAKSGRALQGNVVDHWFAPDISGGQFSSIKDWNVKQIAVLLKTGHNDKNQAVVGPMQQTIDLGTSHLNDVDLDAIALYLKNQPNEKPDQKPSVHPLTTADRGNGANVYADNCASCHGGNGEGVAGIAPALVGAASVTGKQPETAVRAVLQGFQPSGQWGVMPSFAQVFTTQEVADVVNYVRASWGNTGAGRVSPSDVTRLANVSDLGDPGVESALVCPSAPATTLDPATLAQVRSLADSKDEQSDTNKLVAGYRARHPQLSQTDTITSISGAYCRDVMAKAKGSLADRQKRFVAFMGHVAQATATKK